MNPSIRLLHLEDDARDAELIRLRLQADQLSCDIVCVNGKEDFESALQRQAFDLVLSDYKVPGYDGLAALRHVRKTHPELPVIMISGGLSEEAAVDCLKAGATDYVLKQRPQRLETAVRRALVEKEERAALRRAEEEISRQNLFLRQVIDLNPNFIFAKDREGRFVLVNHAMAQAYGTTVEEMTGKTESEVTCDAQEVARFLKADLEAMDTLREVFIAEEKLIDAAGATSSRPSGPGTTKTPPSSGRRSLHAICLRSPTPHTACWAPAGWSGRWSLPWCASKSTTPPASTTGRRFWPACKRLSGNGSA